MDFLVNLIHQGLSGIGPFIILLGLLIFVHELGHFLVAKFYGVRVEVFSLGFGKKILRYKHGDTTYCVSLIPLGGYVKMYGDDPSVEVPTDQKKYSFLDKPVGQRIAIVLAGPLMNLFFAAFLFFCIALLGEQVPSNQIGDVTPGSLAFESGFRSGDKVVEIDSEEIVRWSELQSKIEDSAGKQIQAKVLREDGSTAEVLVTPELVKNESILSPRSYVGGIEGLKMESASSIVGIPDPNSIAAKSGLNNLDIIMSINGETIDYWRQIEPTFKRAIQDNSKNEIELKVKKYTTDEDTSERVVSIPSEELLGDENILAQLGIEQTDLYVLQVKEDSPADKAGLKIGDKLISLNGQEATHWKDVLEIVSGYKKDQAPIEFQVLRDGQRLDFSIQPTMTELMTAQGQDEERYTIGIVSAMTFAGTPPYLYQTSSPIQALKIGVDRTYLWTKMTVMSLVRMVQAEVSTRNLGGVITIGRFASRSFEIGIVPFLKMMAIISINLFLLNLLPVPVLDGGHLVFFTIEALRGAPLSMRKMEIAQQVGLVILMSLMAFALFNDITNLFRSPW